MERPDYLAGIQGLSSHFTKIGIEKMLQFVYHVRCTNGITWGTDMIRQNRTWKLRWKILALVAALTIGTATLTSAQESLLPADGGFVSSNGNLTHLVVCGPAGDFNPRTFDAYYSLCNQPFYASGARWMFSKIQRVDGKNLLLSLTDDPVALRRAIDSLPQLEYIRTERLTEEMYEEHVKPWTQPTQFPAPSWQPMKDFENDAKPLPSGFLQAIQEKRRAIQSAEYTVQYIGMGGFATQNRMPRWGTSQATFRFQGKNQWFADISELLAIEAYQTGCDGKTEWSFVIPHQGGGVGPTSYETRNLVDIKEISLSFLDPFGFLDEPVESLEETMEEQGFRYFGEEEIEGVKRHLFGRAIQHTPDGTYTTLIEITLNSETLLPDTVRNQIDGTFNSGDELQPMSLKWMRIFDIVSTNKVLPDSAFLPNKTEDAEPTHKEQPDEGFDRFFVHINDGSGGRISVRSKGQRGPQAAWSGGLDY